MFGWDSRDAYFNVDRWKQCGSEISLEDYHGQPAYLGLDLASRVDIAAIEILIPDGEGYVRFGRYYLPEATVENGNEAYKQWEREGWLTVTEGEIIDFRKIRDDILQLNSVLDLKGIGV